jgi:hypothetical protein
MTLFLSCFLTNSLNYFKVDEEEWPPAGFDEEESLSFLQASAHS